MLNARLLDYLRKSFKVLNRRRRMPWKPYPFATADRRQVRDLLASADGQRKGTLSSHAC